jgi:glutamate 5-kinase
VLKPQGFLVVDDGARRALVEQGKSLLPSGIVEVRGQVSASERRFTAWIATGR